MKTSILFSACVVLSVAGAIVTTAHAQGPKAAILSGDWEGVIEATKRPIVVAADFGTGTVKLDASGSSSWMIENLSNKGGQVRFQITVGDQAFHFEGALRETEIRGTVRIGEEVLPFWLERLPLLPTPRDRVEAWQQDLDVMLTRFLRYDRSFSANTRAAFHVDA